MIRIAICDDESTTCIQIEKIIDNYGKTSSQRFDTEIFYTGTELCEFMEREHGFDLIFLDIEMGSFNGIDAGKAIRNTLSNAITDIVFISWHESYCKSLFEINPRNFLVKPIIDTLIIDEIEKTIKLCDKFNKVFSYKNTRGIHRKLIRNIIYFESRNKMIRMVTVDGEDTFYCKLGTVQTALKESNFLRIHKSFLVNVSHVTTFTYTKASMSNGETLMISQSKQKEVRASHLDSW